MMKEKQNRRSVPFILAVLLAILAVIVHLGAPKNTIMIRLVFLLDDVFDWCQGRNQHENPYLMNNFAPVSVDSEHRNVPLQMIQGTLPPDLSGVFVRNGPNPIMHPNKLHHWFDGHGMIHSVRFYDNQTTTYSCSMIQTPRYNTEKQYKREIFFKLGEMHGLIGLLKLLLLNPLKQKVFHTTKLTTGQANTHILHHNHHVYALHEASLPYEVVLENDGSQVRGGQQSYSSFQNQLNYPTSAHMRVDYTTNNLLFHGYAGDPEFQQRDGVIKVGEMDQNNELLYYFGVSSPHKDSSVVSLSHDMIFTKHYMILYDGSVVFDGMEAVKGGSFLQFHRNRELMIGLVPRVKNTSTVTWFNTTAPHSIVHMLNAWEEENGETVVIWAPLGDKFFGEMSYNTNVFHMTELRLNVTTGKVVSKTFIDASMNVEFSHVRDDCVGEFSRFGVTAFVDSSSNKRHVDGLFHGFVVWDMLHRKIHKVVKYSLSTGGEAIVIPKKKSSRDSCATSGEAYVGAFVHAEAKNQSTFVLYDLESNATEPIATLLIPYRVPYGFHGRWIKEEELQSHIAFHVRRRQDEGDE